MNILNGIDAANRRIEEQKRIADRYAGMSASAAQTGYISPSPRDDPQGNDVHKEDPDAEKAAADNGDPVGQTVGKLAAALGTDTERLLIIALIALLGSEGADMMLIAALAWLLI